MKTPEETIAWIAGAIGYVYNDHRPLMYGGNGAGVDLLLHVYHEMWSFIVGRYDEFEDTWQQVLEEEECGSANFSTRYSMNHPGVSEEDVARYVVEQWRKVSERLGIPIPRAES
ncbi:MAG: hypothetical protein ACLQNE_05065 [Thermoguttaceae bacterium]